MDVENSMLCKTAVQKNLDAKQAPVLRSHKQSELLQVRPHKKFRLAKNSLPLSECNLWENLDSNILREILSRIPIQDVFLTVSSVCQSWEAACWDYLFWSRNILDLSITGAALGSVDVSDVASLQLFEDGRVPGIFRHSDSTEKCNDRATCLIRKLRRIMESPSMHSFPLKSWRDSIHTIILPYKFEISDGLLLYIAERTPSLQRLLLMCPSKITVIGFTRAVKYWKHLNEIHIGPIYNHEVFEHFIEEMGKNCQELVTLYIHQCGFKVDELSTHIIGKNIPGLKKIGFELGSVLAIGILTLYVSCLHMEEMYFDKCRMTKRDSLYKSRYPDFIADFRLFWTRVANQRFPKWEFEPNPPKAEVYLSYVDSIIKNKLEELGIPPYYLNHEMAGLQFDFKSWIYT